MQRLILDQQTGGARRPANNGFVGGFDDRLRGANGPVKDLPGTFPYPQHAPGPLPIPPAVRMPEPSRTMQYAEAQLDASPAPPPRTQGGLAPPEHRVPPRPYSDPVVPQVGRTPATPQRVQAHRLTQSISAASGSASAPLSASAPATPPSGKRRRSSLTPSPARRDAKDTLQCSGVTKQGNRCTREVRIPAGFAHLSMDNDVNGSIELFCFQHRGEVLKPTGFYSRKGDRQWVKFDDWIPSYLQEETCAALRADMEKAVSKADEFGYIYAFEIRDEDNPEIAYFKVGRTVKLTQRMDQWSKQCGSKEQVLRGYWPGGLVDDDTMMRGRVIAGEPGPWCHRVERLVHLELADLAVNMQYLQADFPNVPPPTGKTTPKPGRKDKCPDCDTMHQEIFPLTRIKDGRNVGKEWDNIVKATIEKWGGFVTIYL